jgi:hypothetical protein
VKAEKNRPTPGEKKEAAEKQGATPEHILPSGSAEVISVREVPGGPKGAALVVQVPKLPAPISASGEQKAPSIGGKESSS